MNRRNRSLTLAILITFLLGNGPLAAQPSPTFFSSLKTELGQMHLEFPTVAGREYRLEASSDLVTWTPAGNLSGTGQTSSIWLRSTAGTDPLPPAGVGLPTYHFVVWAYADGRSLVGWRHSSGDFRTALLPASASGDFTSVPTGLVIAQHGTGTSGYRVAARIICRPAVASATAVGPALTPADDLTLQRFTAARADLLAAANFPTPLLQTGTASETALPTPARRFYRVHMTQVDSDADGIFDDVELATANCLTNPFNPNTDFDLLTDAQESTLGYCADGDSDHENDGLTDNSELAIGTDPKSSDTDGDGLIDGADSDPIGAATLPAPRYCLIDLGPEFAPITAADSGIIAQAVTDRGTIWMAREDSAGVREDLFWQAGRVFRVDRLLDSGAENGEISVTSVSRGGYAIFKRRELQGLNVTDYSSIKVVKIDDFLASLPAARVITFPELPGAFINPHKDSDPAPISRHYGMLDDDAAVVLADQYETLIYVNPSYIYPYAIQGIYGAAVSDNGTVVGTIVTTYIRYPSGDWRNFRYSYQWNPADNYRTPTGLTRVTNINTIKTSNLNFTAVNNRGQAITEPATWAFFSQIPAKLITLPGFARHFPSGLEPTAEATLPNLGFITAAPTYGTPATSQTSLLWHETPGTTPSQQLPVQLYQQDPTANGGLTASTLPAASAQLIGLTDRYTAGAHLMVAGNLIPTLSRRLSAGQTTPGAPTAAHWGALTLQQLTGLATPTDPTQPAAGKSSFVGGKIGALSHHGMLVTTYTDPTGTPKRGGLLQVEFITPAGDPVTAPVDAGNAPGSIPDGANEFTFSDATSGVLTMKLKAKVSGIGSMPAAEQAKFSFEVDTIGNSTFAWDPANLGGKVIVSGDFMTATATYTGLPQNNTDFGLKKARVKYSGNNAGEAKFEVFFPIDASYPGRICNHPGGKLNTWNPATRTLVPGDVPNWYYYWRQLPESQGVNLAYGGATINGAVPAMTVWAYGRQIDKTLVLIGEQAYVDGKAYGAGEFVSGIDWFGNTLVHEGRHVWQIAQFDALVPTGTANSPWEHGWAINRGADHNHWTKGADGHPGEAAVDDDGDGQVDNLFAAGPGELGKFNPATPAANRDQNLTHPNLANPGNTNWPAALPYPNPMPHLLSEVESDAINYADANYDEHRNARKDWGHPGKNHKTLDKWDD